MNEHNGWSSWNPNAAMEQVALDLEQAGKDAESQRHYATASALDWIRRTIRDWLAEDAKHGPTVEPVHNAAETPQHDLTCNADRRKPRTPGSNGCSCQPEPDCPYGAYRKIEPYSQLTECGSNGWLCERCQADVVKAAARAIIKAVYWNSRHSDEECTDAINSEPLIAKNDNDQST